MYDRFVMEDAEPDIGGDYNDPPDNFREINEEEFAHSDFFTYSPEGMIFRQIDPKRLPWKGEKHFLSIRLFHFRDGTGVGISNDHHAGKVRYFKYGCDHKYTELSQKASRDRGIAHFGMCYHVYECQKCGDVMAQDSSG